MARSWAYLSAWLCSIQTLAKVTRRACEDRIQSLRTPSQVPYQTGEQIMGSLIAAKNVGG